MRVLLLGIGTSPHVRRPVMQMLSRGIDVILASPANPFPRGMPGLKYIWYPFGKCSYRRVGHTLGDILDKFTIIPFLRLIKNKYQPDITHIHWVDCHAYYCEQAGLHPLVLSVWGSDINNCFEVNVDTKYRKKVSYALGGAKKILVDSTDMFEKCRALAGRSLESMELLSLGIDPKSFDFDNNKPRSFLREQFGLPSDARIILSARAYFPLYRHEDILLAFSKIVPILKQKTILVFKRFNEADKSYHIRMMSIIKKLGLENSVYWLENIADVDLPDLYFLSDVIVNFPVQDAFPITFLEAAASQRPVVTNMLPGYEKTFVTECFRIVKGNDIDSLAQALFDELEISSTSSEKLLQARLVAVNLYSHDHYADRLYEIYKDLLASPKIKMNTIGMIK